MSEEQPGPTAKESAAEEKEAAGSPAGGGGKAEGEGNGAKAEGEGKAAAEFFQFIGSGVFLALPMALYWILAVPQGKDMAEKVKTRLR